MLKNSFVDSGWNAECGFDFRWAKPTSDECPFDIVCGDIFVGADFVHQI